MEEYKSNWDNLKFQYSTITQEILEKECAEVLTKKYQKQKTSQNVAQREAAPDCGWRYYLCAGAATAGVSFSITMDTVKLMNCSQEWIAYVLVHEVAHAAMFGNVIQWDTANSQHTAMAGQFLTLMANSLMAAYPSLPEFDAYAMCFAGFFNGIEGSPSPEDKVFSLLVAKKITQKFNVSYNDQQLADFGRQYTETGSKGLRNTCN